MKGKFGKKTTALMLAMVLTAQTAVGTVALPAVTAEAATAVTKLEYYDTANGAVIYPNDEGEYAFLYPKINGEAMQPDDMGEYEGAFEVWMKQGNADWTKLTQGSDYTGNYWTWEGGGGWGILFGKEKITESTVVRFQSVDDEDVYLDYTLVSSEDKISLSFDNTSIDVDYRGGAVLIHNWLKMGVNDITVAKGSTIMDLISFKIKPEGSSEFYPLGDAAGGYTWDVNYGWDVASDPEGAYWFNPIEKSFTIRAELKSDPTVYADIDYIVDSTIDSKGPEYDFSNTANNEKYDVKDPGKNKDGYQLVWADEFNGYDADTNVDPETGLNLDNWGYMLGDGTKYNNPGWGNSERQAYTKSEKNIGVNENNNGLLRLTAAYEKDGVVAVNGEGKKYYSSARLRTATDTEPLFTTTYGYIEARMALPATKGAWPAFWMLPQSTDIYGAWPVSGEIDIMETCGAFTAESGIENDATCGTLHFGAPSHSSTGSGYQKLSSDYTYFHTYAVDWEPGQISWILDGKVVYTTSNWESGMPGASSSLAYDAPFDQPFHIILNLAVDSGSFGGAANKATFQDDINMYVDYVRVYQKSDGYEDTAVRKAGADAKDDWGTYAGKNWIADIKEGCVAADTANGNVNSVETAGTLEDNKWYLAYQSGISAEADTVTNDDGTWAKVNVNSGGGQDYATQLIGHYDAKAGYVYKISFDSYATGGMIGKQVNTDAKEWKTWSTYGSKVFTLTKKPTTTVYYITQNSDFDDCRLEFNLGGVGTGEVYIGNVKVEIVDPATLGADTGSRTALANGDLIYNGTFDQGNNHLANWTAGENTTLKVPRYTTEKLTDSDEKVSVVDIASKLTGETENGVKYYARRGEVTADAGKAPSIYQTGFPMNAEEYTLSFDLYSKNDTTVKAAIYSVNTKEDGTETLGTKLLESRTVPYSNKDGVLGFAWNVEPLRALKNAAIVLTFGEGASVQVDNVSLLPYDANTTPGSQNMDSNDDNLIIINYVMNDNKNSLAENADSNPFYYVKGEEPIPLADPTRPGYEFAGWSVKENVEYVEDYVTEVPTDGNKLTLYANWGERVTESIDPDKNAVQEAKTSLNTLIDTYKGYSEAVYTPETWKPFADALKTADEVSKNANATLAEVQAAKEALQTAASKLALNTSGGLDGGNGQNADVILNIEKKTIFVNEQTKCTANVQDAVFASSNPAVATVDASGVVTGKSAGTAKIIATSAKLGSKAEVTITVVKPTVKWNTKDKTVPLQLKVKNKVNKTTVLQPTGLQPGDSIKSYKSSKTKVATVSKNSKGKLTIKPKKTGKTTITVTTQYGATAKFTLKVQKGAVKVKKLTVDNVKKKKLTLKKGKSFTLSTTKRYITALDKVTYSSNKKRVATVSSKGKITAKKKGTAKITVKCGKKKVVIKVTVK